MALTPRQKNLRDQAIRAARAGDQRKVRAIATAASEVDRKAVADDIARDLTGELVDEIREVLG